jgi:hypothetical protein
MVQVAVHSCTVTDHNHGKALRQTCLVFVVHVCVCAACLRLALPRTCVCAAQDSCTLQGRALSAE